MLKKTKIFAKGFTLIELLIVIAILGIIAAVSFVALDPGTRFADARDSSRWSNVSAIIDAIKIHQVDNGGSYIDAIWDGTTGMVAGQVYMINGDGSTTDCNVPVCDTVVTDANNCVDFSALVTAGYLSSVPISPDGVNTYTASLTGYTAQRNATGTITIRACEAEGDATEIFITR